MVQRIKKTNNQKSHHVFLYFIILLVIAAAVVLGLLFFKPTFEKKTQGDDSSSTTSDSTKESDDKKSSDDSTKKEEESTPEVKPETEKNNTQYEGEDPNTSASLTGIINYAGISEGNLIIRVSIEQSVNGTCVFTLNTPSGKTVNGSSAITIGPSSAFCSMTTPATESGTWKISVGATSADKHGIITGEANI